MDNAQIFNYQCEPSEDLHGAHLSTSFVPNATQQRTEQETVQQSIQDLQSGSSHTLMWPTIGGAPINEFTTEGYLWPSPPCFQQELQTSLDNAATK